MKKFILLTFIFIGSNNCWASSQDQVSQRLSELENRMAALEKGVKENLSHCELVYKKHTNRLNQCDRGTFTRSVIAVGSNTFQLECGYYQLQCKDSSD